MNKIFSGLVNAQDLQETKRQKILALIETSATKNYESTTVSTMLEHALGCWLCHKESEFTSEAGCRVYTAWSKEYVSEALSILRKHLTKSESNEIVNETSESMEFSLDVAHISQICTWISHALTLEPCSSDIVLIQQFVGRLTTRVESLEDLYSFAALINKNPLHFMKSITKAANLVLPMIAQRLNDYQHTLYLENFSHYVICCEEIGNLFAVVWEYTSDPASLITHTLRIVFQLILQKAASPPAIGLSCVLQVVSEELISTLCHEIITFDKITDEQLLNIAITLSVWMFWPRHKNIHIWNSSFAQALYKNGKHSVLYDYVEQCAPTMVSILQYPNLQPTTIYVLEELLLRHQISPAAFHRCHTEFKLMDKIEMVKMDWLRSRFYRLIQILMYIHSGYPDIYDKILQSIPADQVMKESDMEAVKTKYKTEYRPVNFHQISSMKTKSLHTDYTGLENLGNTCYLNSVIQTLFMIKQFKTAVVYTSCNHGILGELRKLFVLLQFTSRCELSPLQFVNRCLPPWFMLGQQQDSSEYMRYLIDNINEFYKQNKFTDDPASLFIGELIITTECFVCRSKTERVEKTFDMSLHFPSETSENDSQTSIREMISNQFNPEILTEENQFHCDTCDRLVDASRTVTDIKPPDVLTLTLCRFYYDAAKNTHNKIRTRVTFGEELNLCQTQYELHSVIVHSGSTLNGGHYYTYCRDHTQNTWFLFNDGRVMSCKSPATDPTRPSTQTLQSDTPYILIYVNKQLHTPMENVVLESLPSDLKQILYKDRLSLDEEQEAEARRLKSRHTTTQLDNIYKYNYKPDDDDSAFGGNNGADITGSRFVF